MGRMTKTFIFLFLIALIGIQFVEVDHSNPPITGEIKVPDQVRIILKNSCYDCHSNETKWPWYSYIAPISWMIEDDVNEGRRHLNFSEWDKYNDQRREKKKKDIWEEVNSGDMPLKMYTYMHPNSSLDIAQKSVIEEWVNRRSMWE